ncbi:type III-A CRISPR-associated CARF protein Csm6 [Brachyspira intermedia]|uniref:type III-A CRISPR-associated CARF protein Csm6 n=1 Tax=Brachyspira intermedia TaxID=84377 RepID=UPI003003D298
MPEEKKYVLFTPVGGNDPVGDEYYKDDMIEEINKKVDDGKISQDEAHKLITYIESKRNKEPILMEGAILHIVRHCKPEYVFLFFTEKNEKKIKNQYTQLKEKIEYIAKCNDINIKVEANIDGLFNSTLKISDINELGAKYVYDFETYIEPFDEYINRLKYEYKNYQILINITSGTPNLNLKLCLECIKDKSLHPVQVLVSLDDLHTGKARVYGSNKIYDAYENEISRCVFPTINSIRKSNLESQIRLLIEEYNYNAAYTLLEKELYLADNNLRSLVKKTRDRVNLDYDYKNNDLCKFLEYYFVMKIKQRKQELSDFIFRITPFVTELIYYFLKNNVNVKSIFANALYENNNGIKVIDYNKLNSNIKMKLSFNKYLQNNTSIDNILNLSSTINDANMSDSDKKNYLTKVKEEIKNDINTLSVSFDIFFNKLKKDKNVDSNLYDICKNINMKLKNTTYNKSGFNSDTDIIQLKNYQNNNYHEIDKICNLLDKYPSNINLSEFYKMLNDYIKDDTSIMRYKYKDNYADIKKLFDLLEFYKDKCDSQILNLFQNFRNIEKNLRNKIMHSLEVIDENLINEKLSLSSNLILDKCEELLMLIFKNEITSDYLDQYGKLEFDYDLINNDIKSILKN